MIIGKVVGTVVMTISLADYKNNKLLVVQPIGIEDYDSKEDLIALDNSYAGVGDMVLVMEEGHGARQILNNPNATVISMIVGIIDSINIY